MVNCDQIRIRGKGATGMRSNPRCLYESTFESFSRESDLSILGNLCDNYHGDARTTTRDAWKAEITIMQETLVWLGNINT